MFSSCYPGSGQSFPRASSKAPPAQTHCCLPVQRINYKECDFPNSEPKAGAFCQLDDRALNTSFSPVLVAAHGTVLPQCPDPRARAIPGDSEWNQPSTGQGKAARGRHRRGQWGTSGRRALKPREEESGPGPFRGRMSLPCLAAFRSRRAQKEKEERRSGTGGHGGLSRDLRCVGRYLVQAAD